MPEGPFRFLRRFKKKGLVFIASLIYLSLFPPGNINSEQISYGFDALKQSPQHIEPAETPQKEVPWEGSAQRVVLARVDGPSPSEETAAREAVPPGKDPLYREYLKRRLDEAIRADISHEPGPSSRRGNTWRERPGRFTPDDITRGDTGSMRLSITFDGGFEADDAGLILDELKARSIKTTVFLTGQFIEAFPEITRRIVADGHEAGNHTMNHPHLTEYERTRRQRTLSGVDREFVIRELKEAEALFREVTGVEMAPLWRAPYGEVNPEIRKWAFEAGYLHINWTIDYERRESLDTLDWVHDRGSRLYRTKEAIKDRIVNFNRKGPGLNGGIILMHLGTERRTDKAAEALGEILQGVMDKGYRFVKVSELINGNSGLDALRGDGGWRTRGPSLKSAQGEPQPDGFVTGDKFQRFE